MALSIKGLLSPGLNSSSSSIPVTSGPGRCVNCKSQPQARNPATGQYYLFCSNACAAPRTLPGLPTGSNIGGGPRTGTSTNASVNTRLAPALSSCDHCKKKPRYSDGVIVHPYCGRTCANLAKGKGSANTNTPVPTSPARATNPSIGTNPPKTATPGNTNITNPLDTAASTKTTNRRTSTKNDPVPANPRNSVISPNPINTKNKRSSVYRKPSAPTCQIPGCSSAVYVDPYKVASNYCTKRHRQWGKQGCISCRRAPTNGVVVFCQSCHDKALRTAPMIVEVPKDHDRYKSVASQFRQKWTHSTQCPEVHAIYKIVTTAVNIAKYEQYLDRVEAKHNFASRSEPRGNERRRWHGTTRKCKIGDKGVTKLCSDVSCSLCCIMRTSFDLSFFAKKTNWGRFGAGIYTSSTSSKSDGYSYNDCTSDWKAMLLNKVVVGRGCKMTADSPAMTGPPAGYDSVLAEVGARLKYDELVVYNNDAIRPSYLVMYGKPQ